MKHNLKSLLTALALLASAIGAAAQGTAFTYQGQLQNNGGPANGTYDFRMLVYDSSTGGSILGGPITNIGVVVSNGLFTTIVDFGAGVFTGGSNWLHIGVRTNGSGGFTALSPRQQLTPTPYAIYSESAGIATTADGVAVGVVSAPQLNTTGAPASGQVLEYNGSSLTWVNPAAAAFAWNLTGNAGTTPGVNFLGTTDNAPLDLDVNGERGLHLEYISRSHYPILFFQSSVNVIGGFWGNIVSNTVSGGPVVGGTVAGGGDTAGFLSYTAYPNIVNNDFGAIGGGYGNTAGFAAAIPGGYENIATGNGSFAAGRSAQTTFDGSFVWSDGSQTLTSSGANHFDVLASSGVGFYTSGEFDVHDLATPRGTIRVGANQVGGDPKLIRFGDGDYVHIGENVTDDHMELQAASFSLIPPYGPGFVGINTSTPQQQLDVNGEFLVVDGYGSEQAYLGGDGNGGDVQVGSLNPNISNVAFYNAANNSYMHIYCSSITINGGADLAEPFEMSTPGKEIPQGAVVVIDDENPGHLKMSDRPYDTRVAGVLSGAKGINPGIQLKQQGLLEGGKNVALTGRVYVLADASHGAIKPGDLLTTSGTPGHAMKVSDHAKAQGAILGKAMTGLKAGSKGMVLVLVTLQ